MIHLSNTSMNTRWSRKKWAVRIMIFTPKVWKIMLPPHTKKFWKIISSLLIVYIFQFFIIDLTVQPAVASGGGDHHFSLFGLSTVESWAVVGGGVILTLLIIVMMIALLAKRKMRCRLTRGKNTAEIDLNESGQPMMQQQQNTSAVSTV